VSFFTFLSLQACFQVAFPVERPAQLTDVGNSVVAMADGSVMVAQPGTISRDIIDWFNDKRAPAKTFDVGWQPFEPNSAQPDPESQVRLERFAVEMRANRDVNARVIVCGTTNGRGAAELARLRASRLVQLLVARHVPAERVSAAICRPNDVSRVAAFPSARSGGVIEIALSR